MAHLPALSPRASLSSGGRKVGPLKDRRREIFAQELAKGRSQFEAHGIAGYKAHRGNASLLAQDKSILERVATIRAEHAQRHRVATEKATERLSLSVETLLAHAEEARLLAMSIEQPSAAIAAIKEMGVLSGLRVEKSERKSITDARSLNDAELDAAIADALAREAAAESDTRVTH